MYPYTHSRAVSAPHQEVPRQLTKNANEIAGICTWELYIYILFGNWIQNPGLKFTYGVETLIL